jgi:cytochrome c-type biogenesis protein CcsB
MGNLLSTKLFYFSFASYCGALLLHLVFLGTEKKVFQRIAAAFMAGGILFHALGVVSRTREFGHFPVTTMFEFLLIAALFAALGYFAAVWLIKNPFVSACNAAVIVMLMAMAALLPDEGSSALMPALRSNWLYLHVTAAAASEGLFAIGCMSSILYILKSFKAGHRGFLSKIPDLDTLGTLTYRSIITGYLLFTLGALFAGALWANRAWGSFWSWDPKETCSLIVWIIYSAYLHCRLSGKPGGHEGLFPHLLSVAGFTAALLTLFSSMFLGGMHSYG